MRLILAASCLFFLLQSCAPTAKYYVVRHAEKAGPQTGMDARDPELSEAGKQRSEFLAGTVKHNLQGKKITHVFVTNTIRSRSTGAPTARLFKVKPETYPAAADSIFIKRLRSLKGSTLVVGHSNTVDEIVNRLCGEVKVPGDLAETSFDRLYIITRRKQRYSFQELRYGVPTP